MCIRTVLTKAKQKRAEQRRWALMTDRQGLVTYGPLATIRCSISVLALTRLIAQSQFGNEMQQRSIQLAQYNYVVHCSLLAKPPRTSHKRTYTYTCIYTYIYIHTHIYYVYRDRES